MAGIEDAIKDLENIKDELESEVDNSVETAANRFERAARRNIDSNDAKATGELKRKIYSTKIQDSDTINYKVISSAPHSAYVEFGTGGKNNATRAIFKFDAASPSVSEIEDWAYAKGITPDYYDTIRGMSQAIVDQIEEEGTPHQPYMRPAFHFNKVDAYEDVARGVNKAIRKGAI